MTKTWDKDVYTLLVQVGRKADDGLPDKAVGAGILCFASGTDEDEAVRETVALLKAADMAPLDVTGYGTAQERQREGDEIGPEDQALMQRALDDNAVVVVQITPFFESQADLT